LLVAAWVAAALAGPGRPAAGQSAKGTVAEPGAPIAYLSDRPIATREVESRLKARLFKARQEQYELQVEGIRDVAFTMLQDQEAAKAGLTRDAYYKREVLDKAAAPTEQEVQQIFTTYRSRLPGTDEEAKAEVRRVLRERNANQRAEAFKAELLGRTPLRIMLDPPRLDVPLEADDPAVGSPGAPVTLVEFSDFQCPFCQRAQETLRQLRAQYGDKVRMVFKQLPLGMHAQARFAAEVALCANDQQKYWEAREWLFSHREGVTADAAKAWAREARLDTAAFGRCVDEHLRAAEVDEDLALAESLATNATPAFFVNGRLLQGAQPIDRFRAVIDDELVRATPRDPALTAK